MLAEGLDILSNWGMLLGDQCMWSIQDRHGQGVHRLSNHHRHDGGSYRKNILGMLSEHLSMSSTLDSYDQGFCMLYSQEHNYTAGLILLINWGRH